MSPDRQQELLTARKLLEAGELDLAWEIVERQLMVNPDDAEALWIGSGVAEKAKKLPIAWHFAKRVTELNPERFQGWLQFGHVSDQLWLIDQAERANRKAIKFSVTAKDKAVSLTNLAALYIQLGEFAKAEPLLRQALMADPMLRKAKANLGFCQLAAREWNDAWDNYAFSLGSEARKRVQYRDEPEWDGTPGLTVAVYGEQGLGDEISFASMIPDALRDCERLVIDCDARLGNLFRRSFPGARVYGTRARKFLDWDAEDRNLHASIPMGGLGAIYRRSAESFTGDPYLVPDADRVFMWRALFASKKKPAIGIAWTGGMRHTGAKFRQWTLDDLLPILQAIDAHWVCLQYKDSEAEIAEFRARHPEIDLVQYRHATLTQDYDDTAGIVAALDRVISMQTAVVHLAGAIGKQCDVFVPRNSQWRYGEGFDSLPWYQSVRVIRQAVRGHWKNTIQDYADNLARATAERAAA